MGYHGKTLFSHVWSCMNIIHPNETPVSYWIYSFWGPFWGVQYFILGWTGLGLQELINDGDSFVLDAPEKVYVLDGPKASPFEKRQANETAENIERARPSFGM